MTNEEMIEQLSNSILLITQNGRDWLDARDIPMLKACIVALANSDNDTKNDDPVYDPHDDPMDDCYFDATMITEPCEDAVSISDLEEIKEIIIDNGNSVYTVKMKDIRNLPSVQPKAKTGKWISVHPLQEDDEGGYICSECGTGYYDNNHWHYCPNCGTKMESEVEE